MSSAFIPAAIDALSGSQAQALASSPRHLEGWREMERAKVRESFAYFVEAYGSVEPATGAIPFDPWPAQREVIDAIETRDRVIVAKARQLGLSWIALHRAVWVAAFSPDGDGARVLIACKTQEDASNQLRRARRIIERLPDWLRPELGADSATRIDMPGRGGASIRVLTANPEAIRGETASLVIWDEAAFSKNQTAPQIWTALLPAVEQGQLLVVSTGNGRVGDGAQFADLWDRAAGGESDLVPIFLPWNAHPGRDEQWHERTRRAMADDDSFRQEYPSEPDDVFSARADRAVYPPSHLAAAVKLAADNPAEEIEAVELGIDWGDVQTACVYVVPLDTEGGGVRVVGELVQSRVEPRRAALAAFNAGANQWGVISDIACDAAPAGTARTAYEALSELHELNPSQYPDHLVTVQFGRFKEGGGDSKGVNTVGYIRYLLANTFEAQQTGVVRGPRIAIDAEACPVLYEQLRSLARDDRGRVAKPPLDPKRPERGDHLCDALVAGMAGRALARWQAQDDDGGDIAPEQESPPNPWAST